jgi:hypothetical protein
LISGFDGAFLSQDWKDALWDKFCTATPRHQAIAERRRDKPAKKKFKTYLIGFSHIDIAEVQTAEGKLYIYVAIDRTSKFAFVQLVKKTGRTSTSAFLEALIAAVPYRIRMVLTDNGIQFTFPPHCVDGPTARYVKHMFDMLPRKRHRASAHQDQTSLDQRAGRTHEPNDQGSDGQTLSLRPP